MIFKTSYKKTFLHGFWDFFARHQFKNLRKNHISTKLDKAYRLVYKLSYMDEIKFSTFFW